ncbi:MAG: acyl-CoA dehydrogenase family protein [Gammaproteobacteria bacterium]|nr:acyl-CoA dehydrogenase family protein [Gammaproteobacteria bacterium]
MASKRRPGTEPAPAGVPAPIPRPDEILARVARIAPILDRTAAESELERTLCTEALTALHATGLFGLWAPTEVGGYDADLVTQVDVLVELARADMSACWTMMIGTTVTAVMAAGLPDEGLVEVFSGERLPIAAGSLKPSGRAEPVAGGYRVSGKWGFGSGIHHASWIVANCLVSEDGEARQPAEGISLAVPIAEVEVLDDWHVAGLRGTGSSSYSVTDVFVPQRRAIQAPRKRGSFFNANPGPRLPIEHAAVSLGGARRALDEVVHLAGSKRRLMDPATLAHKESFQLELGMLEARWRTCVAGVRDSAAELGQAMHEAQPIGGPATKLKAICANAVEESLVIGGRAFRQAGASAVRETDVLQRVYRDLAVAAQHAMVSDAAYAEFGKALLAEVPRVS